MEKKWIAPNGDIADALAVRFAVFCDEQGYTREQEVDEADKTAWHVVFYGKDGTPAATGRVLDEGEEGAFEEALETLNARGYSDRQVALALLAMTAGKDRRSIPVVDAPKPQPRLDDSFGSGRTYLRVNVGRNQKIAPNFIVGAIVDATGIPAKSIGKIDIFGDHTQVELNRDDAQRVMDTMQDSKIRSYKVTFTPMSGGKPRPSRSRQEGRPYPGKKARDGRRRPAEYKKGQGRSN